MIVADTTSGLPRELLRERGIPVVPQVVIFGDESYHDDEQLDTAAFLQKLKAFPTLPKTVAPEPPFLTSQFMNCPRPSSSTLDQARWELDFLCHSAAPLRA
jgi:fatty acid-binding protein DegV